MPDSFPSQACRRWLSAMAVAIPLMTASTANGQSAGWGPYRDAVRPATEDEVNRIQGALSGLVAGGYQFSYWPPPGSVRWFIIRKDEWTKVDPEHPLDGAATTDPVDGTPEIGLDEDLVNDGEDGEIAETVDHESGHIENPDSNEVNPDGTDNPTGRANHFEIYRATCASLCGFICWLCDLYGPNAPGDLSALCEQYEEAAAHADLNLRPSGQPEIGECACCPPCGNQ